MLSHPKTLAHDATVADLRRLFETRTVRTALLVEGERFVASVDRADLPENAADDEPASTFARTDTVRVRPGQRVRDVLPQLDGSPEGRLVVVGDDGTTLRGLLCLSGIDGAFCSGDR